MHAEQFAAIPRLRLSRGLKPAVAADLSAECHANLANLRIRRINPPLQQVVKPIREIAEQFEKIEINH